MIIRDPKWSRVARLWILVAVVCVLKTRDALFVKGRII